jgi:tripartite ATP-independent transporter DctP family solute receptor
MQVIEQLRFGGIDFARISLSQLTEGAPSLGVLQLPFLYRDEEHMWRVLDGEIGTPFLKIPEEENILGLSWYDAGARNFYTTTPVRSPEDLVGLRIRVQESAIMSEMVELLGAEPVPLVYGDVYSALMTGLVDGAGNNWPSYESMAHYEVARYFYQDQHNRVPEMQVISAQAAEKLSPEDMTIIRECARESALFQREEWARRETKSKEACIAAGVEVTVPDEDDLLKMQELCSPLYDKYAAEYGEVLAAIEALQKEGIE